MNDLIINYFTNNHIPFGYSINIKNEPYIDDLCDSIITPTRLLITIKHKNLIIKRFYLSVGTNCSLQNIINRLNNLHFN